MGSKRLKIMLALVAIALAFMLPGLKRGSAMVTVDSLHSFQYYQEAMDRSACYNFFVYQGSQGLRFSCSYADRKNPAMRYELEDVQIQQEDITELLAYLQTLHWEQQTKLQKAINKLHTALTKDVVVLDGGSSRLELCTKDEKFTLPAGGAYADELWRLLDALRMRAEQADKAVGGR